MKNKYKKIITTVLTICICIMYSYSTVFAGSPFADTIVGFGGTDDPTGSKLVKEIIKIVLTITRIVASGLAIIMITVMGIKYMAAAGSEKAEIKNKLINFTIGIVLVVGATKIIQILIDSASKLNGSGGDAGE